MRLTTDIYQRIVAAKVYIDNNYHEQLDLDAISRQSFLSPFHFHRIFSRVYQHTPHQYLTRKRVERTTKLLEENKAVLEVCNEVGFQSLSSFSTLFKKEIGFAPTYFRNQAWLKKQQAKQQPRKFIPHCFIEGYKMDKQLPITEII